MTGIDFTGHPYGTLFRYRGAHGYMTAIKCRLLKIERPANVFVEIYLDGQFFRRSYGVMVAEPGEYQWDFNPSIPTGVVAAADFGYRLVHLANGQFWPVRFEHPTS